MIAIDEEGNTYDVKEMQDALAAAEAGRDDWKRQAEVNAEALFVENERRAAAEAALREARAELTDDTDSWEHGRRLPGPTDRERIDNALAVIDADDLAFARGVVALADALAAAEHENRVLKGAIAPLEAALRDTRETLAWLRMALGSWAVFRESPRVGGSGEMRDILARIDAALARAGEEK